MAFRTYGNPDNDPGSWFTYGRDEQLVPVRFKIRAITAGRAQQIERSHFGHKRKPEAPIIVADALESLIDKGLVALIDSENCFLDIGDEEAAAIYQKILSEPLKAGASVQVDGRWSDELKRQFLSDQPEARGWILEQSDSLRKAGQEQEGKG